MAKIKFSLLSILALAALLGATGARAQDQTLSYCYSGYCGGSPDGYNGPMGNFNGPGNSAGLDQRKYEAYRYGRLKELEQYRQSVQNDIVQFQQNQATQAHTAADLAKITTEVHQSLLKTYPIPSPGVIDESVRRKLNPLPAGFSEKDLQNQLEPIWQAVKKSDALAAAAELKKLNDKTIPTPGANDAELDRAQAKVLQQELASSSLTDGKGLIEAPFATTPTAPLFTPGNTYNGADIRAGINQMIASQSIMGAQCAKAGATADAECKQLRAQIDGTVAAYYALDRLTDIQAGQMNAATRALSDQLHTLSEFTAGVAHGVANGTISFVQGLGQMINDPLETGLAFGNALAHLPQTIDAIETMLNRKAAEFAAGDARTRGEILGEAGLAIATSLIPGPDVATILEGSVLLKTGVYVSMAEVAAHSALLVDRIPAVAIRTMMMTEHLGLDPKASEKFSTWAKPYFAGDDGSKLAAAYQELPAARRDFLETLQTSLGATVSEDAKGYLVGLVAFENKIFPGGALRAADAEAGAKFFDQANAKFSSLSPALVQPADLQVTRAIGETYTDALGVMHQNSSLDVMRVHGGGLMESYRFSRPTRDGLYGAIGADAGKTALAEADIRGAAPLVDTQVFHVERPLDLRQPEVLTHFGLNSSDLVMDADASAYPYLQTHVLGELAEKHGFDSILSYSAKNKGGQTIFIFQKAP